MRHHRGLYSVAPFGGWPGHVWRLHVEWPGALADRGDLDFRLEGGYPGIFQTGQLMQQGRGGRDGIGAEQQFHIRQLARCHQSDRQGLGARITVQTVPGGAEQYREMGVSSHFLGQSEPVAHFGLGGGGGPVARVTIVWPSGRIRNYWNVARNVTIVAVEPSPRCGLIGLEPLALLAVLGRAGSRRRTPRAERRPLGRPERLA